MTNFYTTLAHGPETAEAPKNGTIRTARRCEGCCSLPGRQPFFGLCLCRAEADSSFPNDGACDPVSIIGTGTVAPTISREWRNQWLTKDARQKQAGRSIDERIQNFGRSATRTRKERLCESRPALPTVSRRKDSFGIASMPATMGVWRLS